MVFFARRCSLLALPCAQVAAAGSIFTPLLGLAQQPTVKSER